MNKRQYDILYHKAQGLHQAGCPDAARELFRELEKIKVDDAGVQYELGMLCMELHDNPAALTHFDTLVSLAPDFLEGRMLLGMMHGELGHHDAAISYLREVLAELPDLAEVHHRVGMLLADKRCHEEAYQAYREVLRIEPDHVGVLCSLGVLLTTLGKIAEARKVLLDALARKPESVNIINNLGRICPVGRADQSLAWYQRGLDIEPENQSLTSNYLYQLNYVAGLDPDFITEKYKVYAPRCYYPRKVWQRPQRNRQAGERLRIGYLSGDLYAHSVAFFIEPILCHHDRSRFEIYCYANRTMEDDTTLRLKTLSDHWRVVYGISDELVTEMIAADGIDILVDLSGHTAGNRMGVCAYCPAPVQVSWIGHPNTTGLPQMDYYLTDAWCDPPGMTDQLYSERLYRLPRIFSCFAPPVASPPVAPPPSALNGSITFGSFNSIAKINEPLVGWWAEMLKAVPGSSMLIKGPRLDDQEIRDELCQLFTRQGIGTERLRIRGLTATRDEHLALYADVDVALDTFPYHGTTTTCEALLMGVPVVTLAGTTHVSRVGVSLLHAVGLDDLIAETPEEYIAKAVALASDSTRLHGLRENIRSLMAASPLMDAPGVTREVEEALVQMFKESEAP